MPAGELVTVPVRPRSLLSADGLYWAVEHLVDNFKGFPPLAIVLVGMLLCVGAYGSAEAAFGTWRWGVLGILFKPLLC